MSFYKVRARLHMEVEQVHTHGQSTLIRSGKSVSIWLLLLLKSPTTKMTLTRRSLSFKETTKVFGIT